MRAAQLRVGSGNSHQVRIPYLGSRCLRLSGFFVSLLIVSAGAMTSLVQAGTACATGIAPFATSSSSRKSRVLAALGAAMTLAAFAPSYLGTPSAHAEALEELKRVGQFGKGLGEFTYPTGLAVDQEDNSVFVIDEPEGTAPGVEGAGNEPANFRLQKFSAALTPEGSATIPTPSLGSEEKQFVVSVAVDASLHRVYVLKAIQTNRGYPEELAATEIEAYSTQPTSGSLPPASEVSTGSKAGVYYVFPTVPKRGAIPTGAVLEPHGLAIEPETHDLIVLGEEREQPAVLWRIEGADTGAINESETYRDGGSVEGGDNGLAGPTSVAAGPHDELYLSGNNIDGGAQNGVAKLVTKLPAGNGLAHPAISIVRHEELSISPPGLTGGKDETIFRGNGPQLSVSSDGSLVYAGEVSAEQGFSASNEPTPGSFEMRGMSTSDGSQRVVFGGGTTSCRINSAFNAVSTGSDGIVYVLDEGESYRNAQKVRVPSSFGFELIKFGPKASPSEGSACPAPSVSFALEVNHNDLGVPVKAEKGELVELVASETELRGAKPSELTWKITGPESLEAKEAHSPPSLQETHRFLKPGVYSVELNMNVTESPFGSPPSVTGTIEVTAPTPTASFEVSPQSPKSGENVTFDAKESVDPRGSCSEAAGCTETHVLEKYTWKFGDGSKVETTEPTYSRSFSNSGSQARSETVELVVTNKEGVQSTPLIEHVTIQGTPSSPPPPPTTPSTPLEQAPPPDRTPTDVSPTVLAGSGLVEVSVTCPTTKAYCGGTIQVTGAAKTKKKGKAKTIILGQGIFSGAAGGHETVTVHLNSAGLALLKKEKVLKAQVVVVAHDSFGDPQTTTLSVTLKAPKTKKKQKKKKH